MNKEKRSELWQSRCDGMCQDLVLLVVTLVSDAALTYIPGDTWLVATVQAWTSRCLLTRNAACGSTLI